MGKLRQACFNVPGSSRAVAGVNISPVSLGIDQKFFLSKLYQCITNGSITVGVVLHGVTYDVCHLVVTSVVHAVHSMKYPALHGL